MSAKCLEDFQAFSMRKVVDSSDAKMPKKITYLIFSIEKEKEIVTETRGLGFAFPNTDKKTEVDQFEKGAFAEFFSIISKIPEPRFAVIEMHRATKDGRLESKVVLTRWSPDAGSGMRVLRLRTTYTSAENGVKGRFGLPKIHQANDVSALTYSAMVDAAFKD